MEHHNEPMHQLLVVINPELYYLRDKYTFIVPKEKQEEVFGIGTNGLSRFDGDEGHFLGYNKENIKIVPSRAIAEKDKMWKYYFQKNTKLDKVSKSNQSQVFEADISLHLDGFCKYARQVNSMLSRQ